MRAFLTGVPLGINTLEGHMNAPSLLFRGTTPPASNMVSIISYDRDRVAEEDLKGHRLLTANVGL